MTTLLLAAGDASGDLAAAEFVRAFRERRAGTRFAGMGGSEMEKAGVELAVHQRELAVGGLFELARSSRRIVSAWRRLAAALERERPDLVVLVDSSGFNLPFARRVRRRSGAPILYYVAPQVWAWRRGRIRKLASRVDRLAVIFPFEPQIYSQTALQVDFVGHPLVEKLGSVVRELDAEAARRELGLDSAIRWVALLPGSRRNEIRHQLPLQLETAGRLHARDPSVGFVLALAPSIPREMVGETVAAVGLSPDCRLELVSGQTYPAIRAAEVVLAKPGTATVEVALLERPMVVMGRANPITAAIVRRALTVSFLAMPNLIAGERIVPEFLQERARPDAMAEALAALLEGPAREEQLARLRQVARALGEGGSARRAAGIAEEMLGAAPS
jgi:lipid-A-disaccharide synthase